MSAAVVTRNARPWCAVVDGNEACAEQHEIRQAAMVATAGKRHKNIVRCKCVAAKTNARRKPYTKGKAVLPRRSSIWRGEIDSGETQCEDHRSKAPAERRYIDKTTGIEQAKSRVLLKRCVSVTMNWSKAQFLQSLCHTYARSRRERRSASKAHDKSNKTREPTGSHTSQTVT